MSSVSVMVVAFPDVASPMSAAAQQEIEYVRSMSETMMGAHVRQQDA
jgi:hypothetical protein